MPISIKKGLILLLTCISIVGICYFYVDKNYAYWAYNQHLAQFSIFKFFSYTPVFIQSFSLLFYIYFIIRFFYKKNHIPAVFQSLALSTASEQTKQPSSSSMSIAHTEAQHCQNVKVERTDTLDNKLLAVANSVTLTYFFKDQLKFIFGRYWPMTWTHHNPSLIQDNAYGFHFFHSGSWYQSFPSGHTALIFSAMTVVWMLFPRLRWVSVLLSLLTVVGLLGMNYHFVSDVIAGGVLGVMVSYSVVSVSSTSTTVC